MKKLYVSGGLYLLALGSAWAATHVLRFHPVAADAQAAVVPVSIMEEAGSRSPGRLRELLRQSADGSSTTAQPYRLTPQERQRLREQLRQQTRPPQPSK